MLEFMQYYDYKYFKEGECVLNQLFIDCILIFSFVFLQKKGKELEKEQIRVINEFVYVYIFK